MFTTFNGSGLPPGFALAWALNGRGNSQPRVSFIENPLAAGLRLPQDDAIICWIGTLASATDLTVLAGRAGLDESERTRMAAFRLREDAVAYAAAHGALRLVLGSMLACVPEALEFGVGEYGKPLLLSPGLRDEPLQFSISHSSDVAAIAISRHAVGIDIEKRAWREDLLDVARSSFAEEQLASFFAASGERRAKLFFRYWTLGEALIKATGMGLHQNLKGFAFTSDGPPRLTRLEPGLGQPEHWHFGLGISDG
ncbi:4'-phosphopantetheinyl transferase superfamily protein [Hyphomicrobium sp.]|uniref:4'-phosphopantetheinyl transferase family protein n=1 Tax=Hyphomicrobium sp. TaxID=82 RepID=UPI0025C6761A|nr:4'-phosphopantetheinyl transferase superfamily protein [Hyphomicrobium sp.]MCC7253654.1 4'-phosphopantetheinyl transferase superfamily protein [Hyphomicrobium sp.]